MIAAIIAFLPSLYSTANAAAPAREAAAHAREAILYLDPANTRIDYTLQGWPHVTHGTFRLTRGQLDVDPASGRIGGEVVVSAKSGDSGSRMRDDEMKNSILEVENYPEITFTPQSAEAQHPAQGDFPARISGVLTLHGTAHQIALEAEVQPSGDRFVATTHFAVPYVAWGLENPSLLIFRCADTVYVDVRTAGRVVWVPAGTKGAPLAARRSTAP
jgi:polyisoprenoid-binding protein YceI